MRPNRLPKPHQSLWQRIRDRPISLLPPLFAVFGVTAFALVVVDASDSVKVCGPSYETGKHECRYYDLFEGSGRRIIGAINVNEGFGVVVLTAALVIYAALSARAAQAAARGAEESAREQFRKMDRSISEAIRAANETARSANAMEKTAQAMERSSWAQNESATAASRAANAAVRSADASESAARAFVLLAVGATAQKNVGGIAPKPGATYKLVFFNFGQTPAIITGLSLYFHYWNGGTIDSANVPEIVGWQLAANYALGTQTVTCTATDTEIDRARRGDGHIAVIGLLRYQDAFKRDRETGFCWRYDFATGAMEMIQDKRLNYIT